MRWQLNLFWLMILMPFASSWSPITRTPSRSFHQTASPLVQQKTQQQQQQQQQQQRKYHEQRNAFSPYFDLILCPLRNQPWSCARQQSARLLNVWDDELRFQWQKLKEEADTQLNATLERRGYSDTTTLSKEKPSTILKKIEIGTNYMKGYLAETMDGFLGREYEYLQSTKSDVQTQNEEEDENVLESDVDSDTEAEAEAEADENEESEDEDETEEADDLKNTNTIVGNSNTLALNNDNSDVEFVEIETEDNDDDNPDALDELKRPGDGNKRRKNKKKKGNQHELASQAANLLVIQPLDHQLASPQHDVAVGAQLLKPLAHKIKPSKQKKRKRRKGGHGGAAATFLSEPEPAADLFGLGLLEELAELDGGKRKKKYPMKYGRSNGVTRFKKKKKKKALMKLMLLGSFLKAKIELLLKLLGAHLQIKFFAIALIGLLINIARFWIDVKRGGTPQKVVYVEHAHHQHHYEDNGSEDWGETSGGYWKRSLQTDSTENVYDAAVTDSYQPRQPHVLQLQHHQLQQHYDPQYLAYRNQWQRK